jgi:AraC-like DNA-binding protein/ABC-type transporter Mla MlaB component
MAWRLQVMAPMSAQAQWNESYIAEPQIVLEPAPSPEAYAAAPIGKYFVGPTLLSWASSPSLTGTALWGELSPEHATVLTRTWRHVEKMHVGYDAIVDTSRLTRIDTAGFQIVWQFLAEMGDRFYGRIGRHAIVRGTGIPGAVVEGFFGTIRLPHHWKTFDDQESAFQWLGRPDAHGPREQARRLTEEALATPLLIRELRRLISTHLEAAISLPDCARELNTSDRSLQRHLQEYGTSFRQEVDGVRLQAARQLLGETEHKLEVVARLIGMSSVTQLSLLIRRATGMTPGEYRRRARR